MKQSKRRGFTLIEMLIVIAVIGILASVVLVGLGPIQRQARDSRRISDVRQVQTALELYFTRNGGYPVGAPMRWDGLTQALTGAGIGVSNVPKDPRATASYLYGSDGASYVIGATFEDANNSALSSDVDIDTFGVSCADPIYCVQL